jgi:L-alanine-DL-glutamate epimerase-like enolase superfamily enzyme
MQLSVTRELIPLSAPFTITGYTFTEMSAVVARISERGAAGEGEAAGVYYLGDDVDRMCEAIEHVRRDIEAGVDRESLRRLLPPGGARNALDCAWDLEAKRLASRSGGSPGSSALARSSPRSQFRPTTRERWPKRRSPMPRRNP